MTDERRVALGTGDQEPGSLGWFLYRRDQLRTLLQDLRFDQDAARDLFEQIRQHGGWQHLQDVHGQSFQSFDDFCADPNGFAMRREKLEARVTAQQLAASPEVLPALTHSEAGSKGGRGKKAGDNIAGFVRGSTSAEYLVARLKRDHPDIAARLAAGEFKSARAAARAAGIKVDTPPLTILRRTWRHASTEERAAFLAEITGNLP